MMYSTTSDNICCAMHSELNSQREERKLTHAAGYCIHGVPVDKFAHVMNRTGKGSPYMVSWLWEVNRILVLNIMLINVCNAIMVQYQCLQPLAVHKTNEQSPIYSACIPAWYVNWVGKVNFWSLHAAISYNIIITCGVHILLHVENLQVIQVIHTLLPHLHVVSTAHTLLCCKYVDLYSVYSYT